MASEPVERSEKEAFLHTRLYNSSAKMTHSRSGTTELRASDTKPPNKDAPLRMLRLICRCIYLAHAKHSRCFMQNNCPKCSTPVTDRPALFTFIPFHCSHCRTELRTSLMVRSLYNLSFILLAAYYLLASGSGPAFEHQHVTMGLFLVCIPLLISLKVPRYEAGAQRAPVSTALNVSFCGVVLFLLSLWAGS